ncbi:MFS transporter [Alphaproteobacteria bacterium]|jgi:MFS family permease|nr:MFS transporter [Alphaproteobacteria bacterium]
MINISKSSYLGFLQANARVLTFGFLMAFASTFGQSYFIGIFSPDIEAAFGLSHTEWGSVYMVGTLLSAALLTYTGSWADKLNLRLYALLVCGALTVACLAAAFANSAWFLIFAIFLLRQTGQGLATHTAVTGMVKVFQENRGKAVAIASLGFPTGRALAPVMAVAAIAAFGWRETYVGCAILIGLMILPAVAFLLRSTDGVLPEGAAAVSGKDGAKPVEATLLQAVRGATFYLLLPGFLATAFFDTALGFHLLSISKLKGWSPEWVTAGYIAHAAASLIFSIWAGSWVDRYGAVRLLPYSMIPYVMGLLVLGFVDHAAGAWVYLALFGVGFGIKSTLIPVALSDLYGTKHVGAIRSFTATLSVFSTALGPPVLGWALDIAAPIAAMTWIAVGYFVLSGVMMGFIRR